jgi:hypothetical protein
MKLNILSEAMDDETKTIEVPGIGKISLKNKKNYLGDNWKFVYDGDKYWVKIVQFQPDHRGKYSDSLEAMAYDLVGDTLEHALALDILRKASKYWESYRFTDSLKESLKKLPKQIEHVKEHVKENGEFKGPFSHREFFEFMSKAGFKRDTSGYTQAWFKESDAAKQARRDLNAAYKCGRCEGTGYAGPLGDSCSACEGSGFNQNKYDRDHYGDEEDKERQRKEYEEWYDDQGFGEPGPDSDYYGG